MAVVYVENGNVDKAIKKLRKKLDAEGTLKIYREKQYYTKPGDKRRERKKKERRQALREMSKQRY